MIPFSPGAPERLAQRLGALRDRYFVGRAAELDLFKAALASDERPFAVLYVFGPGGVGKTVLLRERWQPMFEAVRFPRALEADFLVGDHRFGVFVHDWRVDPPHLWVEAKAALDDSAIVDTTRGPSSRPLLEVLSQPDFEAAVRQALRDYHRPALASNPLLRSRLAFEYAGGTPTVATLKAVLGEAVGELRRHPRDEKLYRAVACTYLEPAGTQELAAERLGLPYNTYRYRLAAGIARIRERLWQRELQAVVE
jgi:hypothetical protein